jgi:lysozyme
MNEQPSISIQCLNLVKHFEGLYLSAYKCPAGIWTIGYGHTGIEHNDGSVCAGRMVTRDQADELLSIDLGKCVAGVRRLVRVPLSQGQVDALVSFAFNAGLGNLERSTLLRKLNGGDDYGAAGEFPRWCRAGTEVLPGLVRRRKSEQRLFCGFPNPIVEDIE